MKNRTLILRGEHLKLINFISLRKGDEGIVVPYNGIFGGGHVLDDIATILGWLGKAVPNSEKSPDGRAFDDETEKKMLGYYNYVKNNIEDIEELIHQSVGRFKVVNGIYSKDLNDGVWRKVSGGNSILDYIKCMFAWTRKGSRKE